MGSHLQPEWIVWFSEVPRHLVETKCYWSPNNFAALSETFCMHVFHKIFLIYYLQLDTFLSARTLIIHLAFSALFFSWMFSLSYYKKWNKWSRSIHLFSLKKSILAGLFSVYWHCWCGFSGMLQLCFRSQTADNMLSSSRVIHEEGLLWDCYN